MEQKAVQKIGQAPAAKEPNLTGIPTQMKLDLEERSGFSFDDVRVHYNSDKPAQIGALAYTQGSQVHIGPGQEQHLRHELGHVIQQKAGLVRPTRRIGSLCLNDDPGLEREADCIRSDSRLPCVPLNSGVIQRKLDVSVSLQVADREQTFGLGDLVVDTIKLSGRSDTGLKNGSRATQGDHIIADALIKKYQKVVVRNQPLYIVYQIYQNLFREIESDNNLIPQKDERIMGSNEMVSQGIRLCQQYISSDEQVLPQEAHRKRLKEVITFYNDAYAASALSTYGHGTGGHGEKAGMASIRNVLFTEHRVEKELLSLLDIKSLANAVFHFVPEGKSKPEQAVTLFSRIFDRFLSMIGHMRVYSREFRAVCPDTDIIASLAHEDADMAALRKEDQEAMQNVEEFSGMDFISLFSRLVILKTNEYIINLLQDTVTVCKQVCGLKPEKTDPERVFVQCQLWLLERGEQIEAEYQQSVSMLSECMKLGVPVCGEACAKLKQVADYIYQGTQSLAEMELADMQTYATKYAKELEQQMMGVKKDLYSL